MPRVSVIIPTVRPRGLDLAYESLAKQTYADFEVLVGSPHQELDFGSDGIWVEDDSKGGFWSLNRIYNKLFAAANGELIVTLQDFIKVPSFGLQRFVEAYDKYGGAITGIGHIYETLDGDLSKHILHEDQRKRLYPGKQISPCDYVHCEWNWACFAKSDIMAVGGMDEELDFLGFGGDQLSAVERMFENGTKFFIDPLNEIQALEHKRPEGWDDHHVVYNGRYASRRDELKKQGLWPNIKKQAAPSPPSGAPVMTNRKALHLEDSPYFKRAEIERPESMEKRPTVSLFVLAKNASSCIERLLRNVGPYIDEVVMVMNDTHDDTDVIVRTVCDELKIGCVIVPVTSETHPEFYILDVEETYQVGRPLHNETYLGPFTGRMILSDWAGIRNLGWTLCSMEWKLFLDADDVVVDPESIPGICKLLEENGRDLACSRYHYDVDDKGRPSGESYRERLAKNVDHIRWIYPTHECLAGQLRTTHIDGNLIVRDMRDNKGDGIRIPGRCFKILYHEARRREWEVTPRIVANLVMEVRHLTAEDPSMLEFADNLLKFYLNASEWPEERGWVTALVAEMHEKVEEFEKAAEMYEQSLKEHPGSRTAFRLCRCKFQQQQWKECIAAFDLGVQNKVVHQALDDGPLQEQKCKILVANAYLELKEFDKAQKLAEEALEVFAGNSALMALLDLIKETAAQAPAPSDAMPSQPSQTSSGV